ncbi:MAG: clostripain-related cysteine peptidase [Ilumatobacteraceae bacterium]
MRSKVTTALAVLVAGALVAACSDSDAQPAADATTTVAGAPVVTDGATTTVATTEPGVPVKPWTVLVYSIADTDLEPYMMTDVEEMGGVGTSDAVNVLALVDRSTEYTDVPVLGLPNWDGAKLLQIGQGTATVVDDYGAIDTGDPSVLADFIATGIRLNPAEHYALILSDHGAAWPGVGADGSADDNGLSLAELHQGIADGLAAAGVEQLDMLGFDACLMATYEVASELAPVAQRMVASQELEPGHGWDYRSLQVLADQPGVDVDTFGRALLDGFEAQAAAEGTSSDITLHLIDLTQMAALDEALGTFAAAVDARVAEVAPVIGATRAHTLEFGRSPDPEESTHMADLGQLVAEIGIEALDVSAEADAVSRAINDVVLASVKGRATLGATGLSIYFPETEALLSPEYAGAVGDSPWSTFLAGYYHAGDEIPTGEYPTFQADDDEGNVTLFDDGVSISAQVDPATVDNVADTTISYGIVEADGSITYLGEESAGILDDGSAVAEGFYDLTVLQMSDGIDTVEAYSEIVWDDEAGIATISVPMAYYAPGDVDGETYQDVLLVITVEAETFEIIDETYYAYDDSFGGYGELTADPAGLIVPEQYNVGVDGNQGWYATSDIGLFADLEAIELDFVPLASGLQVWLELTITDFGGNTDTVTGQVTMP